MRELKVEMEKKISQTKTKTKQTNKHTKLVFECIKCVKKNFFFADPLMQINTTTENMGQKQKTKKKTTNPIMRFHGVVREREKVREREIKINGPKKHHDYTSHFFCSRFIYY